MEVRRRDRIKDGSREVLRDIGRSMPRIRHEHPQPGARGDVAHDGEMTHPGRQRHDVATHDFELGNFDLACQPKAMFPIRVLFEEGVVSLGDTVDMGRQLFHLTLVIAAENRRMYCLHLSVPCDTRWCFRMSIALPSRRESQSNRRRDDQCGETQARRR